MTDQRSTGAGENFHIFHYKLGNRLTGAHGKFHHFKVKVTSPLNSHFPPRN